MDNILSGYIKDVTKVLERDIEGWETLKKLPYNLVIWSQINGGIMGLNHVLQILSMDYPYELHTMYPELFPQDDESEVTDAECAE